ncbi:MAG: ParB/RepB/Spo0J family partition protein [Alphaproteobacteria bacterium]|nr:MAG: ParB/RepB/Spo0J family partition protein [Alphaproteobacteria bacterium]
MADEARPKGLGRGLSALLGDETEDYASLERVRSTRELPIEYLEPNPNQPRRQFDEGDLNDLSNSIKEKGILQPILVRRLSGPGERYQIVAGERRWRAAQKAAVHNVPVIIKDLTDAETLEIALIENVQRADLNPIDEAAGYRALMDEFDHTQEDLAKLIGKSRSHIANSLRLLTLPGEVRELIVAGRLSAGHGRTLVGAANAALLAKEIIARDLNVREAEQLARGGGAPKSKSVRSSRAGADKDADTLALERNLTSSLGLKVEIDAVGEKGTLKVHFTTLEQLDALCQKLSIH